MINIDFLIWKDNYEMDRITVRDESTGEFVRIPIDLLLTNEYFKNMRDVVTDFSDVINVNDMGLDLWSFMRILIYDMSRTSVSLTYSEILSMDKLLMKTDLAHFSDRTIVSGTDSLILYDKVKTNKISFNSLTPEFQDAVLLEMIKNGDDLSKYTSMISDMINSDEWIFYPNYIKLYAGHPVTKTIEKIINLKYTRNNDMCWVLEEGIEPYVFKYLEDPKSFCGGIDKNFCIQNNDDFGQGGSDFILIPILKSLNFDLARKVLQRGVDINALEFGEYNLLTAIVQHIAELKNVKSHLLIIKFMLEVGFNPVLIPNNTDIFQALLSTIKYYFRDFNTDYQVYKESEEYKLLSEILLLLRLKSKELQPQYDWFLSGIGNTGHDAIFIDMLNIFYTS